MTDSTANSTKTVKPKGKRRGGSWKKGQSGNPSGRPKDVFKIATMARELSVECLEELAKLMRSTEIPPQAKIAAINSILDRGLGKPMQSMQQQHLGPDGQPISPSFNVIISEYANPAAPQEAADRLLSMQDHRRRKR